LEAIALSSGATIVQVEFFAGTNALGVATNSPYNLTVSNLEAGVYVVMARATDDLGGKGISNPVNFKVEPAVSIRLTSANRLGNGDFQCSMTGLTSDVSVIVQASTDLIHWTDIATQMVHGTTLTFTDTNAIVFTARYYRVAQ
jgi:chitinase